MRTLKHGILARPVLERVIRETAFYDGVEADMDRAVERLRRQVEVRLEGEVEIDEVYVVAGHKGSPAAAAKRGDQGDAGG